MNDVYIFDARSSSIDDLHIISSVYDNLFVIVTDDIAIHNIRSFLEQENCNVFAFITSDLELVSIEILYSLFEVDCDVYVVDHMGNEKLSEYSLGSDKDIVGGDLAFMDYLSCFNSWKSKIEVLNAPMEIRPRLISCLNSLENVANFNKKLMYKGSFLDKLEIHSRSNDTCFDNICLKEFVKGEVELKKMFESKIVLSGKFKNRKLDFFKLINAVRPNDSNSIQLINGYPSIYKLYSSYLFECAKIKKRLGFISSSFMYFFRSLETYCDGFLMHSGIGQINDQYNKKGILKRSDAFLVNGNFVSGFGGKWNEISNTPEFANIPSKLTNDLKDMIQLRNNFILTHGDVRFDLPVLDDVESNIFQFIIALEGECNQTSNTWNDITDKLIEFCSINVGQEFKDLFVEELLLTITEDLKI
ncbi:hypothetical protein AB4527_14510 [Vibrio breoganii]|uniref:hypothetical protein n=1 Tax=Vibrio breoganii TaxID=553239 RepID=UPI000C820A57|nr:hypothetical protein [Vibrio breoganii]PMP07629.1 hypothetical protein BCS94_09135 [Vibrio breoganii]